MTFFYFFAIIPIVIGGILWALDKRIVWQEWLIGSMVALALAITFNIIAIYGMTDDIETWSGKITEARFIPRWHEYYEYAVYRTEESCSTDSKGNRSCTSYQVFDHWESSSRWHDDQWLCYSDIETTYNITESYFNYFVTKYDNKFAVAGIRYTSDHASRMISGDPNDYVTVWTKTQWIEPVTKIMSWKNKIKAAPSVFSFVKVATNIAVLPWPENPDPFRSERVMGTAKNVIDIQKWDQLNADLGPKKKINLIIVGFPSEDSMMGHYQQAKWIGGKKNDLVITFGGNPEKPMWAFTFGWTESELVKQDIDAYIMEHGVNTNLYSFINNEVLLNYKIKDWKKFDYIKVTPSPKYYYWYIGVLIIVQMGLWVFFHFNDVEKGTASQFDWGDNGFAAQVHRLRSRLE
jgi:hypothetical protein